MFGIKRKVLPKVFSTFKRNIQTIRKEFQQLDGNGTVDLDMDEETGLATIRLSNPNRKNAISGKMMSELSQVIQELSVWPKGKAVIIFGNNNFFCSGGDLNTVRKIADPMNGRKMSLLMHDNCTRLQSLPLLSIAFIEGMALGGGAEIATSCDFRVMTSSAQLGFVHIRIGIVSAWGGGSRLSQLVGPQMALNMMLSGRTVGSEEALKIGLIDYISENLEETKEWLKKYTENSLESVRAVKKIVNSSRYLPLELALKAEIEYSSSVWGSLAHKKLLNDNIKHK